VGGGGNKARFSSPVTSDGCHGLWSCTRSAADRSTTEGHTTFRFCAVDGGGGFVYVSGCSRAAIARTVTPSPASARTHTHARTHAHTRAQTHIPGIGRRSLLSEYRRGVIVGRVPLWGGEVAVITKGPGRWFGVGLGSTVPNMCFPHFTLYTLCSIVYIYNIYIVCKYIICVYTTTADPSSRHRHCVHCASQADEYFMCRALDFENNIILFVCSYLLRRGAARRQKHDPRRYCTCRYRRTQWM